MNMTEQQIRIEKILENFIREVEKSDIAQHLIEIYREHNTYIGSTDAS